MEIENFGLIKIYMIGSNVPNFKNPNNFKITPPYCGEERIAKSNIVDSVQKFVDFSVGGYFSRFD